jgi:hypothetical protein
MTKTEVFHTQNVSTPGVVEFLTAPHRRTNWLQTYTPTRSSPSVHLHAVMDKNLH